MEHAMPARTPDKICRLFRRYMHDSDLDAVMTLYDREAVFVNQAAELNSGPRNAAERAGAGRGRKSNLRVHQHSKSFKLTTSP
jgi:hypothetical protein